MPQTVSLAFTASTKKVRSRRAKVETASGFTIRFSSPASCKVGRRRSCYTSIEHLGKERQEGWISRVVVYWQVKLRRAILVSSQSIRHIEDMSLSSLPTLPCLSLSRRID